MDIDTITDKNTSEIQLLYTPHGILYTIYAILDNNMVMTNNSSKLTPSLFTESKLTEV